MRNLTGTRGCCKDFKLYLRKPEGEVNIVDAKFWKEGILRLIDNKKGDSIIIKEEE